MTEEVELAGQVAGPQESVTAAEPDQRMLAQSREELPSVRSVPGSAEDIPLPGEHAAWLWNVDDDRASWVAELARIRTPGPACQK